MTEQPLDMRTTVKGLWRRRLLLGALAVAGLCGGIGYGILRPQMPRAVTLVLLSPSTPGADSNTGSPAQAMQTQIVVATSDPVLAPAGHAVSPPLSAADLKRQVSVKALSQQVLQVEVAGPRSRDAVALANAVANNYVHYVTEVLPGKAAGGPVQILQPATNALPASKLRIPILAGIGIGAGLLVGLVLAVVLSNRDRRLRSRDEISRAIGVPVLASLEAKPCKTVSEWQSLLDGSVPSPVTSWSLRRLLHRLAPSGAEAIQEIRVISFRNDRAALAAGAQLATMAATLRISTALVPGDDDVMVPLRAAYATGGRSGRRPELRASSLTSLKVGDAGEPPFGFSPSSGLAGPGHQVATTSGRMRPRSGLPSEREDPKLRSDHPALTIHLVVVERSNPGVRPFGGANVVSVSAGFATGDDLARLALAAADAAQALDGILVVNPEPNDLTTGSIGDGEVQQKLVTRVNGPSGSIGDGEVQQKPVTGVNGPSGSIGDGELQQKLVTTVNGRSASIGDGEVQQKLVTTVNGPSGSIGDGEVQQKLRTTVKRPSGSIGDGEVQHKLRTTVKRPSGAEHTARRSR